MEERLTGGKREGHLNREGALIVSRGWSHKQDLRVWGQTEVNRERAEVERERDGVLIRRKRRASK